jgi:hypothetical protein
MSLHRRTFLNTAAVAAAASIPGCMAVAPAAASICKAAPYVPRTDDPALALAERFSAHHTAFSNLPVDAPNDVCGRAWLACSSAAADCYSTPPQTAAGALALVSVMIDRENDCIDADLMAGLCSLRDGLAAMAQS